MPLLSFLDVKAAHFLKQAPHSIPLIVAWITDKCNLKCQMCNQWKKNSPDELTTAEWLGVINSARRMRTKHFTITGGEPFMREDLFEIIAEIRNNGISCHLCTNGTLIPENISRLKSNPPNSLSVSIDSTNPKLHDELRGTWCFDKAIAGIKTVKKQIPGIKVGINHLLCKKNYNELGMIIGLAKRLDVDRLNVMPIHTNLQHRDKPAKEYRGLVLEKEDLRDFEKKFKKFLEKSNHIMSTSRTYLEGIPQYFKGRTVRVPCYAGYLTCAINADGGVSPCDDMDPVDNVRNRNLEKIWKSREFQRKRKAVRKCTAQCWDTTHANLNILLSPKYLMRELPTVISNFNYYIKQQ